MQAVALGTTSALPPLPASPGPRTDAGGSGSLLSSLTNLRERLELKVEVGRDGEVELDLRARLQSRTRAQLSLAGPEGAVRAVARLSESISLRIHLEIQAEETGGGLKTALQQLASGFTDALDSLTASLTEAGSGGGAKLVSSIRDAFASLLDGLKPAFEGQTVAAAQTPERREISETRGREREASREVDEARPRAHHAGREDSHRRESRSLDPRFVRLRSDLQNRFAQGLNILLQTLEGRVPDAPAASLAAAEPAPEAAAPEAPVRAPEPTRSAFEIQIAQRQQVRFRLLELRA